MSSSRNLKSVFSTLEDESEQRQVSAGEEISINEIGETCVSRSLAAQAETGFYAVGKIIMKSGMLGAYFTQDILAAA